MSPLYLLSPGLHLRVGATSPTSPQGLQDVRRSLLQRQRLPASSGRLPVPQAKRQTAAHVGRDRHEGHGGRSRRDVPEEVSFGNRRWQ